MNCSWMCSIGESADDSGAYNGVYEFIDIKKKSNIQAGNKTKAIHNLYYMCIKHGSSFINNKSLKYSSKNSAIAILKDLLT